MRRGCALLGRRRGVLDGGHPVVAEYPTATAMAHAVLVLLAWHPDLVVPTLTLHTAAVLFVALCILVAMVLYMAPMKMVAVR